MRPEAFAERALLPDENLLFEQNNESNCHHVKYCYPYSVNADYVAYALTHQSTSSTAVGKAKLMSYKDIVGAQAKRDAKEAIVVKGKPGPKRKSSVPIPT